MDAPPEEVLKVIGNPLFYYYTNPGIVAPKTFGIVLLDSRSPITYGQQRNLGNIAKVLRFTTSEMANRQEHASQTRLHELNTTGSNMLRRFFLEACEVPELEDYFDVRRGPILGGNSGDVFNSDSDGRRAAGHLQKEKLHR